VTAAAERAARLDQIQARAEETAARIRADADADAQASEDYAVRQSQAQAEPGAQPGYGWQAGIPEADLEPEA
jgi:F0F1-type ATP synthase membrane subunit b/b'